MTERDLRKMNRKELLELLIEAEEENNQLREQLSQQEEELRKRNLEVSETGNLAEAVLRLNGVFESADRAAAQYVEHVQRQSLQQKILSDRAVSEAEEKARAILTAAEEEKRAKIKEADEYWDSLTERLEAFYEEHQGLKELLAVPAGRHRTEDQ